MVNIKQFNKGVLTSQDIEQLVDGDRIFCSQDNMPEIDKDDQLQPASLDLRLGPRAYRLQASFLPQSYTVKEGMQDLKMYDIDLTNGAVLERDAVYLIPLAESIRLDGLNIRGKTNPKSSIGRLDVFTRVITDYSSRFEEIAIEYEGGLYLEVVPRSFTIEVTAGQRLNQLRLFSNGLKNKNGHTHHQFLTNSELSELYHAEDLLFDEDQLLKVGNEMVAWNKGRHISGDGLLMSIDLEASKEDVPIGFKAKKNSQVINLSKIAKYVADDFWEPIYQPKNGRLILEPEEFYIFASKERIRVPLGYAAEMVEFDAGSGELRTHYAGFFDPGFGYGKSGEVKGTKAVLEVRPHDVPFIIEDGQILFKMKYERMNAKPKIWYGKEIGSNYHDQGLRLAKQFKQ